MTEEILKMVTSLPEYERLPSRYWVYEIKDIWEATQLLEALGYDVSGGRAGPLLIANDENSSSEPIWREPWMLVGDYITFRRDPHKDSGWSIITYAKKDFEERYRRIPCLSTS